MRETRENKMSVLHITITSLPEAFVGEKYSVTLTATGGRDPYTWRALALPLGLKLSGGKITGTPTKKQTNLVTLSVKDTMSQTATATFTLVVEAALIFTGATLPTIVPNVPYSYQFTASGVSGPYTFALTSDSAPLPQGLTLSASGLLSGTTSAPAETESIEVACTSN